MEIFCVCGKDLGKGSIKKKNKSWEFSQGGEGGSGHFPNFLIFLILIIFNIKNFGKRGVNMP